MPLRLLAGAKNEHPISPPILTLSLGQLEKMKRDHGSECSAKRGDHLGVENALQLPALGGEEGDGSCGGSSSARQSDHFDARRRCRVRRWHEQRRAAVCRPYRLPHWLVDASGLAATIGRVCCQTAPECLQQTVTLLQRQLLQHRRHV
ncbi:hypothetical protein H113_00407 [Trichophyton rubrum MR1459]|uniref:Uncharacterized protein n=1 Tax=Trichophyton rubrum (strain ATCC MYA-4607 / CBS 118892) TaxID=559305 RepID=A0A080WYC9_TRIRC|nr:uncharacterized protein TERG_12676 [Trichophyton rubrum CBS 118892]EZG00089.1 hypothetical protein H113_00407 [Trichophyton rubrum MR1459]KFL63008.1 hypothetical protein TERG_12676 [Trichophyton rubrum CBS 118892]